MEKPDRASLRKQLSSRSPAEASRDGSTKPVRDIVYEAHRRVREFYEEREHRTRSR